MITLTPSVTVGQAVAERPQLSCIFEELKIDYCCGGKRTLEEACRERGLDVGPLIERLEEAGSSAAEPSDCDWTERPLTELCDNIVRTHHDYLRCELPRLTAMIDKVLAAHGTTHPELAEVRATFACLRAELEPHMMKEECVLFPSIRYLEANGGQTAQFPFGSLANPIRVMVSEHDHAADALERLRELTAGYVPPTGACNTYRAMLEGLGTLERDMHRHVHKENSILFPRAVQLEDRLGRLSEGEPKCRSGCSTI